MAKRHIQGKNVSDGNKKVGRCRKAETAFRPLSEMSKSSNAAKDYNNVIKEIMTEEEWNEAQEYIESKRRNKKTGRFQKVD